MKLAVSALTFALTVCGGAFAAPAPIAIVTGPVAGFAFPLGGEICRLYETSLQDKARCTIASTDGSVENLKRLRNGDVQLRSSNPTSPRMR